MTAHVALAVGILVAGLFVGGLLLFYFSRVGRTVRAAPVPAQAVGGSAS